VDAGGGGMSVLAYKDGVLAADSGMFVGGRRYTTGTPKVVRSDLGLFGACGDASRAELAKSWFLEGMTAHMPAPGNGADETYWEMLWVRTDGTVWWSDGGAPFAQMPFVYAVGLPTAAAMCDGVMHAGLPALYAVEVAIERCAWLGGPAVCVALTGCLQKPPKLVRAFVAKKRKRWNG
jgi:hypothetical protein